MAKDKVTGTSDGKDTRELLMDVGGRPLVSMYGVDPSGDPISLKTDAAGNLITVQYGVDPNGDPIPLLTDAAGNLVTKLVADDGAGATVPLELDGSGNLKTTYTATSLAAHTILGRETFLAPDAAGTVYLAATAKGGAQPAAATAQPDYPRTMRIVTDTFTSADDVNVTVHGTDLVGATISDVIVVPAAGTTTNGVKTFATVTTVEWTQPASWSAGTIALQAGPALGLAVPSGAAALAVTKEVSAAAHVATGTVNTTNRTYVPTTAMNGTLNVDVWFKYTIAHGAA